MSFPLENFIDKITRHSFEIQKAEARLFPIAHIAKWSRFVENFQQQSKEIPSPFQPVGRLAQFYLTMDSPYPILDVGCETGKNAYCLIKKGHKIVLLDITPKALEYTVKNLRQVDADNGILDTIIGKIEHLDSRVGPFKAVVGTYAFSFIAPSEFVEVMEENVLNRIVTNGYFVGGFFGEKHAWSNDPELTIVTTEKVKSFLIQRGFSIIELTEEKKKSATVLNGTKLFHTISVIAQKTF